MKSRLLRLHALGFPRGLIATTDADSEPAPDCAEEVSQLATAAMEGHLDRRLRASHAVAGLNW